MSMHMICSAFALLMCNTVANNLLAASPDCVVWTKQYSIQALAGLHPSETATSNRSVVSVSQFGCWLQKHRSFC